MDDPVRFPLHAGAALVYDGQAWDVAELTPPSVLLERPGEIRRVSISHLLAATGTRLGEAGGGPPDGGLLAGLDNAELAEVRARTAHVREAATGYRRGSPELAAPGEPRPEYGPAPAWSSDTARKRRSWASASARSAAGQRNWRVPGRRG